MDMCIYTEDLLMYLPNFHVPTYAELLMKRTYLYTYACFICISIQLNIYLLKTYIYMFIHIYIHICNFICIYVC